MRRIPERLFYVPGYRSIRLANGVVLHPECIQPEYLEKFVPGKHLDGRVYAINGRSVGVQPVHSMITRKEVISRYKDAGIVLEDSFGYVAECRIPNVVENTNSVTARFPRRRLLTAPVFTFPYKPTLGSFNLAKRNAVRLRDFLYDVAEEISDETLIEYTYRDVEVK